MLRSSISVDHKNKTIRTEKALGHSMFLKLIFSRVQNKFILRFINIGIRSRNIVIKRTKLGHTTFGSYMFLLLALILSI